MSEIADWIEEAGIQSEKEFRRVVHIILSAISESNRLKPEMIMKGGILMAIRYHTGRHTRDIDFSTREHYARFSEKEDKFIESLDSSIKQQSAVLAEYGIACAIQGWEIKPKLIDVVAPAKPDTTSFR